MDEVGGCGVSKGKIFALAKTLPAASIFLLSLQFWARPERGKSSLYHALRENFLHKLT